MELCLDTSAILKLKKEPQLLGKIANKDDLLATTKINAYELLVGGFFYGGKEQKFIEKILKTLVVVSVEEYISLATKITAKLMKAGKKVNDFDVLIAATCIGRGMKVVTSDKHFDEINSVYPINIIKI